MVAPLAATQAYAAVQSSGANALSDLAGSKDASGASGATGFAQMVNQVLTDTLQNTKNAETQMAAHTQGKAELVDVVTAISSAQTSLETVMAVRDQVISAYQEIMHMPI